MPNLHVDASNLRYGAIVSQVPSPHTSGQRQMLALVDERAVAVSLVMHAVELV